VKLYYSPTSPYVRKVLVTAIEKGIESRIERIAINVWDPESPTLVPNPLGKIPSLITDDGDLLYDSPVICEYLDALRGPPRLLPAEGRARWQVLRRQALGDGLLDAGVARRLESNRPEDERSASWIGRQTAVIVRSLDALEAEADTLDGGVTLGEIAIGCALGWLDFRFAAEPWRNARPRLAEWYDRFAERPSMRATTPREP
jgi:glutathione S-transferase